MSANSSIEWTDTTWNPVRGCSRVSAGCDNCYAMRVAHRFSGPGGPYEGLTRIGKRGVDWAGSARLVPSALVEPLRWRRPRRIFVNSMSDLFHESLSNEEIAAVFGVMAACPQHTFQVLTKRVVRAMKWFEWARKADQVRDGINACVTEMYGHADVNAFLTRELDRGGEETGYDHLIEDPPDWPLPNVQFGFSAENQETYDARAATAVHGVPAALHFASLEPMIGPIKLRGTGNLHLGWVIVGGESGNGARPFDLGWALALRKECAVSGIPFFFKQAGAVPMVDNTDEEPTLSVPLRLRHRKGADLAELPEGLRVREFPLAENGESK